MEASRSHYIIYISTTMLRYTGKNNPSGIKLEKPKYIIVEYCYFYNNGVSNSTNKNAANITVYSDYILRPFKG